MSRDDRIVDAVLTCCDCIGYNRRHRARERHGCSTVHIGFTCPAISVVCFVFCGRLVSAWVSVLLWYHCSTMYPQEGGAVNAGPVPGGKDMPAPGRRGKVVGQLHSKPLVLNFIILRCLRSWWARLRLEPQRTPVMSRSTTAGCKMAHAPWLPPLARPCHPPIPLPAGSQIVSPPHFRLSVDASRFFRGDVPAVAPPTCPVSDFPMKVCGGYP